MTVEDRDTSEDEVDREPSGSPGEWERADHDEPHDQLDRDEPETDPDGDLG